GRCPSGTKTEKLSLAIYTLHLSTIPSLYLLGPCGLPSTVSLIRHVGRGFLMPSRPGCGVLFVIAQDGEHSLRVEMCAGRNNVVDRRHRGEVRAGEDGAGDGGHDVAVAIFRQRRRVAVRDSECRHAALAGALRRLDGLAQTPPETDCDQQILRVQNFDLVDEIARASHGRL